MRSRLAQIVVFATAGLFGGQMPIHAQQADAPVISEVQDQSYCPRSSTSHEALPAGPEVSIDNVSFSGFLQMPISDQDKIAASIRQEIHGDSLDGVIEEALERVRAGWQNRGYFKVQVSGDTRTLTKNAADLHIALFVHVYENLQYRLNEITFKHSNVDIEVLRSLFPIKSGDIFNREKIATGLENLRKAYGEMGYINFVAVPNTNSDDQKRMISLDIDLDSGKQFYVRSVNVLGLDEPARQELARDLPIKVGQIYNSRLWELSLLKHSSMFPDCACPHYQPLGVDEQTGTVGLTLDFRPCSAN
jgi:outer membrane protein assembly factor BamA